MKRGTHILLADDETAFRFSASVALRGAGYRVSMAENGREAFVRIMESQADGDPVRVLVTDQQMPEMTGSELAAMLHDKGIRIPVIVVTAFHDRHAVSGFSPGTFDELIEKPIEPEDLVACLNRVTNPPSQAFS